MAELGWQCAERSLTLLVANVGESIGVVAPQNGPLALLGAQVAAGAGFEIRQSGNTLVAVNEICEDNSGAAVGDALVAAQRRAAAQALEAVGLAGAPQRLAQPPCLAQRVLAGRRVGLVGRRELHLDVQLVGKHDRAVGEGERADRGDHHRLHRRVYDRTAGGEVVSGGSGRCRDDQPVGAERIDELPVEVHFDLDDAGERGLVYHHVVEDAVAQQPLHHDQPGGDADEQIGVNIVRRALEEPLRQIVQNAGKEGAVVVERVKSEKNENIGFNAATETFEDLVKAGVIDPAKVTRTALQNAASIAGLMLTTEAMVSELPEDEKGGGSGMPGGMGGMSGMGM